MTAQRALCFCLTPPSALRWGAGREWGVCRSRLRWIRRGVRVRLVGLVGLSWWWVSGGIRRRRTSENIVLGTWYCVDSSVGASKKTRGTRTVSKAHFPVVPRALWLPGRIPSRNVDIVAFLLVPVDHLLGALNTCPWVVFAPDGRLWLSDRCVGTWARDFATEGLVVHIRLATSTSKNQSTDDDLTWLLRLDPPIRDPAPLQKEIWSEIDHTSKVCLRTAQIQPPSGQGGMSLGTWYQASRFHGVLMESATQSFVQHDDEFRLTCRQPRTQRGFRASPHWYLTRKQIVSPSYAFVNKAKTYSVRDSECRASCALSILGMHCRRR